MENNRNVAEEQLSVKEFLKGVFNFFNLLGRNWRILLIGLLLGSSVEVFDRFFVKKETTYMAKLVFNLELGGDSGGQLGGFASQLGLGGMQSSGGDLFSRSNFPLIMQSLAVHEIAFMKEVTVDGKKMLFINYFIDSSDIKRNEWGATMFNDPSPYANYKFTKKDPEDFTPYENQIILSVYNKIVTLSEIKPVEKSTFIECYTTTTNEKLTKVWIETLLSAAEEFYRDAKTKKSRQMLAIQSKRLDSLRTLMQVSDRKLSRLAFDNPNVVDPNGAMQQQQVTRNNNYYSQQYITQLATVENLQRMVLEQTPIFTIVEPIRLPLFTGVKAGLKDKLLSLSGLLIALVFVVVRNLYREIMNN